MADAGKIMIMPKGAYDASVSYEILDLVTHNDIVWVAKKDVTGVEPSDANAEYWFKMVDDNVSKLGGKDASEYLTIENYDDYALPRSGGRINGDITLVSNSAEDMDFIMQNSNRQIIQRVGDTGGFVLHDATNGKRIIESTADGTNTFNGTASGNLPLSGGYLNGRLAFQTANNGYSLMFKNHSADNDYGTVIMDTNNASNAMELTLSCNSNSLTIKDIYGVSSTILHTGNKPTGSYTGNGSATSRTIATGGIGYAVVIWATTSVGNSSVFVNVGGYGHRAGTAFTYSSAMVSMNNGNIILATDDTNLNESGTTYYYQVL